MIIVKLLRPGKERYLMVRFLDILFSAAAILVLAPFMVPVVIGLLLTGEHKVFYLQERIGLKGRPFMVVKFATMLENSPNMAGGFITTANDPRILPMGHFLRKSKINELPQLLNILAGQMSFVGPRPNVKKHLDLYTNEVRNAVLSMRPGLTGIGSIVFRDEEGILDRCGEDRTQYYNNTIMPYKGALELWYAERRGILVYFMVILLTALAIIRPRSEAYRRFFKDLPEMPVKLARCI